MSSEGLSSDISRQRLHWTIELAGHRHDLEILPGLLRAVSVELDGQPVIRLTKPSKSNPWQEGSFASEGRTLVVALSWAFPVMNTDVFVDGHSAIDGTPLAEVRQKGPKPVRGYNLWMDPGFRLGIENPRLLPPGAAIAVAVSLVTLGGLAFAGPGAARVVPAFVVALALAILAGVWIWIWLILSLRANRYLLAHVELGDLDRMLRITAVFLGWPVVTAGSLALIVVMASR